MTAVNRILLVGRVVKEPDPIQQINGKNMTTFRLATETEWEQNGEKKQRTTYHSIRCWGKLVEYAQRRAQPGKIFHVEGSQENFFSPSGGYQPFVSASFVKDLGFPKVEDKDHASCQETAGGGQALKVAAG